MQSENSWTCEFQSSSQNDALTRSDLNKQGFENGALFIIAQVAEMRVRFQTELLPVDFFPENFTEVFEFTAKQQKFCSFLTSPRQCARSNREHGARPSIMQAAFFQ